MSEVRQIRGDSTISIVDDDSSVREATRALLRSEGYEVQTFGSAEEFLDSGALKATACLVTDIRMSSIDGLELQRRLKATHIPIPIIFVTAHDDKARQRIAAEAGAVVVLGKPFEGAALVRAVEAALDNWGRCRSIAERPLLTNGKPQFVGRQLSLPFLAGAEQKLACLQHRITTLKRHNQDLQDFVYAASHDLQEPLRTVSAFADLLAQPQRRTGPEALEILNQIVAASGRMRELLGSLLAYAELETEVGYAVEEVDLNEVLQDVNRNLATSIQESGASIESAHLPLVAGRQVHFVQLFQNLVGNALKYCGKRPPTVRISVDSKDHELAFSVADNGIGINDADYASIFQPFKRLHEKRSQGTGMGLAICRRIVERYGGRIWVESQPDAGSTFIFTLPTVRSEPHADSVNNQRSIDSWLPAS